LLIGTTVLVAVVVRPIVSALLIAVVLAAVLWPLHMRLSRWLGKRRQLSASLIAIAVLLLLAVPMIAMSAFVVDEASRGIEFISETVRSDGVTGLIEELPPPARKVVREGLELLPRREAARLEDREA
jgi:predicted PurR-regulated permease PerM